MSNEPGACREQLRRLVGEVTRRDASDLGPDDDLIETFGLDSLMALRVMAIVEKRFDIRIPDAQLATLRTLRKLEAAIAQHQTTKP